MQIEQYIVIRICHCTVVIVIGLVITWFGHFERKDGDCVKESMSMEIEGTRWRGCPGRT